MEKLSLSGSIVDIINRRIFPGTVHVAHGKIISIQEDPYPLNPEFILPGFIDSHVHIESSMLIPSEFARLASVHGTIATVSDPHEIGNVLGIEGVRYMIHNGKQVPFHFFFGVPSCVPATSFETSGASIGIDELRALFMEDQLHYLSEMMNFPGVLSNDPLVMEKIKLAHSLKRPIDGHAPGLRGNEAQRYIEAGIFTDHECFILEEALEKISYGMHILIREGSAAKNFEALHPLIGMHPDRVMFCSDDKHPHELVKGHINDIVRRSLAKGYDLIDILRAATLNPAKHYQLDVGLLRPGDSADFIVAGNLSEFPILKTYIKGKLVASHGTSFIPSVKAEIVNRFHATSFEAKDFTVPAKGPHIRVIEALEGELITRELLEPAKIDNQLLVSDISRDHLKLAVVNRYSQAKPAIGFIRGFGLKQGAIASCVAHDSHNIIAVGTTDEEICLAVNTLMQQKGGIAAVDGTKTDVLPLPIAGIMSPDDGYAVAKRYAEIDAQAKKLGTPLQAPFMTLSFMALLVIPALKLSDQGLFNGEKFQFTPLNF